MVIDYITTILNFWLLVTTIDYENELVRAISCLLKIDQTTLNEDFGHYARVESRDECHLIYLSYERLPDFCITCSSIGHVPSQCYHNKPKADKEKITKKSGRATAQKQHAFVAMPNTEHMVSKDAEKPQMPLQNIFAFLFEDEVTSADILAKGKSHTDKEDAIVVVDNVTSQDVEVLHQNSNPIRVHDIDQVVEL
ncbi:Zinc knuckle CX2CX4HX4C [Trema orientale]|uniref:Zinc knuckle CX2CX4HX4C n=1 Tax=Trema orientale TaxID=63057 RepID=A0A2P5BDI3_TREOI|nr:Zinc knuckle CX2CX4HX4C [Trema orientale]